MNEVDILVREIKSSGKSYRQIGITGGIVCSRVGDLVTGKVQNPSFETVKRILNGLGRSLSWLEMECNREKLRKL